jgi:hypothetical protein
MGADEDDVKIIEQPNPNKGGASAPEKDTLVQCPFGHPVLDLDGSAFWLSKNVHQSKVVAKMLLQCPLVARSLSTGSSFMFELISGF